MFTRKEAEAAQQTLGNATIEGVQLQLKWAAGFGNKQQFDFTVGESILRINEMKEQEKRWVQTTARGGGPLETGMAMEEPDVQIGSKIDSTFGDPNLTKNDPRSSGGFRGGFRSEQVYGGDFNQRNQRGNEFNQTKSFQQQNGLQGQHQYQGNFEGHGNQNRMPNTTNQQQSRFQDFSPQNLNTLDNYRPNNINSTINPDAMIINDDFKDEVNKLVGDAARVLSPMIPNLLIPPQSVVNVIKPVYDTSGFPPGAASMMGFPPSAASMNRANQEDESVAKRTRMM